MFWKTSTAYCYPHKAKVHMTYVFSLLPMSLLCVNWLTITSKIEPLENMLVALETEKPSTFKTALIKCA